MDKARFLALWKKCLCDDAAADAEVVFESLFKHYSQAHRRYHTPHHIEHCLEQFDWAADLMKDRDAVEMAIWFHDVIECQ